MRRMFGDTAQDISYAVRNTCPLSTSEFDDEILMGSNEEEVIIKYLQGK